MNLYMAVSILTADISRGAWIDASLIDASLVIGTVAVNFAFWFRHNRLVPLNHTLHIRRTEMSRWTHADGLMVGSPAESILSTSIDAWIATLLVVASALRRTVVVANTFGILARCSTILDMTNTVGTARRWIARIWCFGNWHLTLSERIADHFLWTHANRVVIDGVTLRSESANGQWTRINAFSIDTGLVA